MTTQPQQYTQTVASGAAATVVAAKLLDFGLWFQAQRIEGDRMQFTVALEHARLLESFCRQPKPGDARAHALHELQQAQHQILATKDLVAEFGVEWDAIWLAYESTRLAWYVTCDDAVGTGEKAELTKAQFEKAYARIREALGNDR